MTMVQTSLTTVFVLMATLPAVGGQKWRSWNDGYHFIENMV